MITRLLGHPLVLLPSLPHSFHQQGNLGSGETFLANASQDTVVSEQLKHNLYLLSSTNPNDYNESASNILKPERLRAAGYQKANEKLTQALVIKTDRKEVRQVKAFLLRGNPSF